MAEMRFEATRKQRNVIEGLAYQIADNSWQLERLDANDPEKIKTRETISSLFDECDKLEIPFWVQNSVVAYAEDWRRYKSTYTTTELLKKGIKI